VLSVNNGSGSCARGRVSAVHICGSWWRGAQHQRGDGGRSNNTSAPTAGAPA
jgi:hypothetical protein